MRLFHKFILAPLFLFPSLAMADSGWVPVAKSVKGSEYYVYLSEAIDAGDLLYVRTLSNYSARQDTGELSSISNEVISCSRKMVKATRMSTYSEKDGRGQKLTDHDLVAYELDIWQSAQPGSITYTYVERLCNHFEQN